MATNYITIKGFIKNGELNVDLPENVMDGEIEVKLPVIGAEIPWEDQPWTEEELAEFMVFEPIPAYEIETGGWEHLGITDSVEWLNEQKRKRREQHKW